jgi:hypothetical protein
MTGRSGGVLKNDPEFHLTGLLQTPVVETDFIDKGLFRLASGPKVAAIARAQVVVFSPFLGREAEGARTEVMFARVLAGDRVASLRARPGGGMPRDGGGLVVVGHADYSRLK